MCGVIAVVVGMMVEATTEAIAMLSGILMMAGMMRGRIAIVEEMILSDDWTIGRM